MKLYPGLHPQSCNTASDVMDARRHATHAPLGPDGTITQVAFSHDGRWPHGPGRHSTLEPDRRQPSPPRCRHTPAASTAFIRQNDTSDPVDGKQSHHDVKTQMPRAVGGRRAWSSVEFQQRRSLIALGGRDARTPSGALLHSRRKARSAGHRSRRQDGFNEDHTAGGGVAGSSSSGTSRGP